MKVTDIDDAISVVNALGQAYGEVLGEEYPNIAGRAQTEYDRLKRVEGIVQELLSALEIGEVTLRTFADDSTIEAEVRNLAEARRKILHTAIVKARLLSR